MHFGITFHPSWWNKNADIDFSKEFFFDPEYRMECDIKMRKVLFDKFGEYGLGEKNPQKRPLLATDLLAAGFLHSAILGCEIIFSDDNSPQVVPMNISDDEIDSYVFPALENNYYWKNVLDQIDYLESHYGKVETYYNLMGILNIAIDVMGDNALTSFYTNPDGVNKFLSKVVDLKTEIGRKFKSLSDDISGGVTSIVRERRPSCYLTSNCTVEMISNEIYEEFLLPQDIKLAESFGDFGIHHCGGTMEHVVSGYRKVPNLTFVEVGTGSNVAKIREALPHVEINARYSAVTLLTDTKEMIENNVEKLFRAGDNKAHQISISCVGIDSNMKDEQVTNFLASCQKIFSGI